MTKTRTLTIDEEVLRAVKVRAARTVRAEAEVLLDRAKAGDETSFPANTYEQRRGEAVARVFRAVGLDKGERTRRP